MLISYVKLPRYAVFKLFRHENVYFYSNASKEVNELRHNGLLCVKELENKTLRWSENNRRAIMETADKD